MMTMTQEKICDVRVDSDGWNAIEPAVLAELCLEAIVAVHPQARQPVSILFTDDAAMTALNAEYRAKEGPTNVLSFPAGDALPRERAILAISRSLLRPVRLRRWPAAFLWAIMRRTLSSMACCI